MSAYTLTNGKNRNHTDPLNFKYFDYRTDKEEIAKINVHQLRSLEVDGVIIRNFLSTEEAETMLARLFALPENQGLDNSKTFPGNYALIDPNADGGAEQLDSYFQLCKKFTDEFESVFGVNLIKKIQDAFSLLNNGNATHIPRAANGANYTPLTFRMIHPEKCHINIHCGNQFLTQYPAFYKSLLEQADVWNQLSFFTVVQKPEVGGELSVYNVAWDVAKEIDVPQQAILTNTGAMLHAANPAELFRQKFSLNQGDLILFSAGQLWHRVEEVFGSKWRVTAGGFLGFSKTDSSTYIWS